MQTISLIWLIIVGGFLGISSFVYLHDNARHRKEYGGLTSKEADRMLHNQFPIKRPLADYCEDLAPGLAAFGIFLAIYLFTLIFN